jgi:hypothetical protein
LALEKALVWVAGERITVVESYINHNVANIEMTSTAYDPNLMYRHRPLVAGNLKDSGTQPTDAYGITYDGRKTLDGLICLQGDGTFGTGSKEFRRNEDKYSSAFPSKGGIFVGSKPVSFNGPDPRYETLGDGKCLIMEQNEYIKRLPCTPITRSAKSLATAR